MRAMLRSCLIPCVVLAVACGDDTGPTPSIEGQWLVTAYESDGVTASAVSGTANFTAGGTLTFNVLITFPGEPQDTIDAVYTWSQAGSSLTMTEGLDTSEWSLTFGSGGSTVVLQLLHDASASRLTLVRP